MNRKRTLTWVAFPLIALLLVGVFFWLFPYRKRHWQAFFLQQTYRADGTVYHPSIPCVELTVPNGWKSLRNPDLSLTGPWRVHMLAQSDGEGNKLLTIRSASLVGEDAECTIPLRFEQDLSTPFASTRDRWPFSIGIANRDDLQIPEASSSSTQRRASTFLGPAVDIPFVDSQVWHLQISWTVSSTSSTNDYSHSFPFECHEVKRGGRKWRYFRLAESQLRRKITEMYIVANDSSPASTPE